MNDPNTIAAMVAALGAIAAAVAAFVSLVPASRAARESKEQTNIQRELMKQESQPYVWADIQPDNQQGTMLHLVVGNSGPTVARNVRVTIDPPIPEHPKYAGVTLAAQKRLNEGILSLAPKRVIRWSLGRGFDFLEKENDETVYRLVVEAEGPYGPLEPVEFEVRPRDWREARDAPDGNLHFVRKEIEKVAKATDSLAQYLQQKDVVALTSRAVFETALSDSVVKQQLANDCDENESGEI